MEVTCPSGLSGEIRGMKGTEANFLSNRKLLRTGEVYEKILQNCWVSTTDPGPYEFYGVEVGSKQLDWRKILSCDRFFALVAIRMATYGEEYEFQLQCPSCECKIDWVLNLAEDLDVFDLPQSSIEKIKSGTNAFEISVGEHKYVYSLPTGSSERSAMKVLNDRSDEAATAALESRLISVDGDKHKDKIRQHLLDLELPLQLDLINAFETADGGIDTELEVECYKCGGVIQAPLPFGDAKFWLQRKNKPNSQKRSKARKMFR